MCKRLFFRRWIEAMLTFTLLMGPMAIYGYGEEKGSFIVITGKTNVNTFEFHQKITFLSFNESPIGKAFVRIAIPVQKFETQNQAMYNDFEDLLKVNEFPFIYIDLLRTDFMSLKEGKTSEQSIGVYITIAGTTKRYSIASSITTYSHSCFMLVGQRDIRLPDFKIDPPQKFFGMVKVGESIMIKFNLSFCLNPSAENLTVAN
jgi:hypothetical protein